MTEEGTRHATPREIADLADGVLGGPRRTRVEAHVGAGCAVCEDALVRHRALAGALAAGALPAPPAATLRRAVGLFGAARRAAVVERIREVVAMLVLDQRLAPAAALRGGPGDGRRLLWTIGAHEIVVSVAVRDGAADILGEALPADADDDAPEGAVRLERDGASPFRADLDEDGAFAFRGVASGAWVLAGTVDGTAFRTPPFVIA